MLKEVEKLLTALPINVCREVQLEVHAAIKNDRSRRIKELVREWVGESYNVGDREGEMALMFEKAASRVDAIDDAEVPEKKVMES